WPLLSRSGKSHLLSTRKAFIGPNLLSREFMKQTSLDQRLEKLDRRSEYKTLAHSRFGGAVFNSNTTYVRELNEVINARFSIDERHPFTDRRLIEFAAAMPQHLHRSGELGKRIIRL